MPQFYKAAQVYVDHRVFEVWDPVYRVYAIADLRAAWIVKRRRPGRCAPVRRACANGALATVVLGVAQNVPPGRVNELVTATVVIVAASVATGARAVLYGRDRRVFELWVLCNGAPVKLVASTDPEWFNDVCRALQRAVEGRKAADP